MVLVKSSLHLTHQNFDYDYQINPISFKITIFNLSHFRSVMLVCEV